MLPEEFAQDEYKDLIVYQSLLSVESSKEFKKILVSLIEYERRHFSFWLNLSSKKIFCVSPLEIIFYKSIRKILGLTFTIKLLERHEKQSISHYNEYLKNADKSIKGDIEKIIEHELKHEKKLVAQIKEEQVEFISSIILGLNDGLIELTGALVGFSFAFGNHKFVALTGLITGFAASMSMAASAYMQARHEEGKDATKSGLYTGISYISVVLLLVSPFLSFKDIYLSLLTMFGIVVMIILSISYYTSVIFGRKFVRQFGEMFTFSVIIAIISFLIGLLFKNITGISL